MTNKSLHDVVTWDSTNKSRMCSFRKRLLFENWSLFSDKNNIGCELNGLNRFGSIDRGCRFVTFLFDFQF